MYQSKRLAVQVAEVSIRVVYCYFLDFHHNYLRTVEKNDLVLLWVC